MRFTFYGHACFAIEVAGKKLLFDPFITPNEKAKDIDINSIQADYIMISHGHGDHVADAIAIAKNTGATIVAFAEVSKWFTNQGCEKVHGMNYGNTTMDFGEVRMVMAGHSSSMPDGSYGGNPAGFVLKTAEGNIYYAGDTCLMLDMQLIPKYFAKLDYAILPVGGNYTMNPEDALVAADFVQCDKVIGVHHGTWPVIAIDEAKAKDNFKAAGKTLILPAIGETIDL